MTFLIFLFSAAIVYAQPTPTPTPQTSVNEDSLVHFGDVIDVDFVGGLEYDWRGSITSDGFIDGLDAVAGRIPALCRSETDIAADLEKAFAKILRSPRVRVRILDRSGRAVVRLDGAIKTPTRFRVQRAASLRELIVLAGGFTDGASGNIKLFRPPEMNCVLPATDSPKYNGTSVTTIKIHDLLTGDAVANIQVLSGDSIEIERADPVYVIGAVASPRPVFIRSEMTVSRAVASAGGLTKDADARVTIFRRQGTESVVTEADLGKIKRGEIVDTVLMPFDIIDVAGKGIRSRKFPPIAPNLPTEKKELPLRVID